MLTEKTIVEQIQADPEMMAVLAIIRDLNLADAWLAAGAVRKFHLEPAFWQTRV